MVLSHFKINMIDICNILYTNINVKLYFLIKLYILVILCQIMKIITEDFLFLNIRFNLNMLSNFIFNFLIK